MRYVWGFLIMLVATQGFAQVWELKSEKKGIAIYTREVEGSSFLEFKGETELDANLATLVSLLWTVEDMPQWMFGCVKAELIESSGDLSRKLYLVNAAPGPLKNRDLVIQNIVTQDPSTLEVTYTMDKVDHPIDSGHVQVKTMNGIVKLVPLAANRTKIIYQAHVDPAGIVPAWAANMFVKDNPYNTLIGARKILQKKQFPEHPGIVNYTE